PCFYGIDFATRAELIANGLGIEEIVRSLGADSLGFISEEGMIAASGQPEERLCTACFSGKYPVTLPEPVARAHGILQAREPEPAVGKDACTPPHPAPPPSPTPPPAWTPPPATGPWS